MQAMPMTPASDNRTRDPREIYFENAQDFLRIGRLYAQGRSIPADPVTAYQWLSVAISKGSRAAAVAREQIMAEMDRDELRHARAEARRLIAALS